MGSITEATILHHVCIVLLSLWFLSSFNCCHPVAYFLSLIYLYLVHEGYVVKLRKKLQFEEKRESNQRRVLSESETVRWLNHAIEKIWPVCMEEIVSQKILLPIFPWFLKKYKPWTVSDVEIQHLYLGRSPPIFTEMRVLQHSNGDDHLVLELGMNFRTADDMSAILGVKLRKRLGFGMSAKLHMLGMHVEGKVLVGVKFRQGWPFISRLRVCFAGPPYFQMTVKPIFSHGLDVTELPGIAGWIDNLLALVFEQTLVEPNMLVVDVEKFASPKPENWFSVDAKEPIAYAIVEVLEAADMKPSDLNGLADPYVKGNLGPYRFRTKTQKKTLAPKWREEFKIPICSWESQSMLVIEVRDKDRIFDDIMGDCSININELRDGQRHDMWLPLQNVKTGRLHLAVTVSEVTGKEACQGHTSETEIEAMLWARMIGKGIPKSIQDAERSFDVEIPENDYKRASFTEDSTKKGSFSSTLSEKSPKVADKFEPIKIEGKTETGVWIHHPGSEVAQVWEPRKGKTRHVDIQNLNGQTQGDSVGGGVKSSGQNDGSGTDDSTDSNKSRSMGSVRRGFRKLGSVFRKSSPRDEDKSGPLGELEPSLHDNIRALNAKEGGVKLIIDDSIIHPPSSKTGNDDDKEGSGPESPHQGGRARDMAKSIMKQAGKSARGLRVALSRKSSRKNKAELETFLECDDSSFSDDESLSSPADSALGDTGLVIGGSTVSTPSVRGNDSFKLKNSDVQTIPAEVPSRGSSFNSTENTTQSGGNDSFKSEELDLKDSAIHTPTIRE